MIYVFKNLDTENREIFDAWQRELGERFKPTRGGFLSCAARFLLKTALENEYGLKYRDIEFARTPQGKPYAKNGGLCFSISHSHNAAAAAVSRNNIGIDIQKIKEYNAKLAERICSGNEKEYISKAENKARALYSVWAAKESLIKLEGHMYAEYSAINSAEAVFIDFDRDYAMAVCGGEAAQQRVAEIPWRTQ